MVIVLLFCSFTTIHEQRNIIEIIRNRKLESIRMPLKLKSLMYRCLGSEAERASVNEIQSLLRELLREQRGAKITTPLATREENRENALRVPEIILNDDKAH
jgi:hypothetical protein